MHHITKQTYQIIAVTHADVVSL